METTEVMSKYETITIVLSTIAILIPLIQWGWRKWIVNEKVKFYPTGQATIFFNQSGSYIRFFGVLESENKATTIKKMRLVLTRKLDNRKLNFVWSYFISPVNHSMLGNYVQTMEAAHPFRVEADSVACAFVEYSDPSDAPGIRIRRICDDLTPSILQIASKHSYDEALAIFLKTPEYIDAKNNLLNEFFWKIGKYTADVSVEYGKGKSKTFFYEFTVSEQNSKGIQNNIDESLIRIVKEYYHMPMSYKCSMVDIIERKT